MKVIFGDLFCFHILTLHPVPAAGGLLSIIGLFVVAI